VSEEEAREARARWIKGLRAEDSPRDAWVAWLFYHASPVVTPAEAREALSALPRSAPVAGLAGHPFAGGVLGRAYWLAGDAERAEPLLRAATAWCGSALPLQPLLEADWRIARIRDFATLGELLEKKGDKGGACARYAAVLARWGKAKPRSVTADKARARSKALGCP
jgi:serine/threonine-protein kinase